VLGLRRSVDPDRIPRVTFTQPEIGAVGIGVERARQERLTIRQVEHRHVDRAVAEHHTGGFSRLVLDRRGCVVGATLAGPRAGEALAEVALAIAKGLRPRALAGTMHAYPTYADGVERCDRRGPGRPAATGRAAGHETAGPLSSPAGVALSGDADAARRRRLRCPDTRPMTTSTSRPPSATRNGTEPGLEP